MRGSLARHLAVAVGVPLAEEVEHARRVVAQRVGDLLGDGRRVGPLVDVDAPEDRRALLLLVVLGRRGEALLLLGLELPLQRRDPLVQRGHLRVELGRTRLRRAELRRDAVVRLLVGAAQLLAPRGLARHQRVELGLLGVELGRQPRARLALALGLG